MVHSTKGESLISPKDSKHWSNTMIKRSLSQVSAKAMESASDLVAADKPKVPAGIDTDGTVFQITLPLMVKESDLTITEAKKPNTGEVYDKANVCFKFAAKGLTLGVQMDDGTVRYYKVKNNAGPYGADRYISFGFDPTVYFTRPAEQSADDVEEHEGEAHAAQPAAE